MPARLASMSSASYYYDLSAEMGVPMRTKRTVLSIGKADGTVAEVPMRYNGSHQRGYRCFMGALADLPEAIHEDTLPSFQGRRLFDALAEYRKSIEPAGWRLLHAVARRDCWPRPDELFPGVQQLTVGVEQTERIDGFARAEFNDVATVAEQEDFFNDWMKSLSPVHAPRAPRKSGHEQDEAVVDFSSLARLAGEYLVSDEPSIDRVFRKAVSPKLRKRRQSSTDT